MYRVVLIEDEVWTLKAIEASFSWESRGFELVETFTSPREAYERLRANPAEVVITDIRMPGLSGLDVIRMLKADGVQSEFVIVSGHSDFDYAREALRYGVTDYLVKPVSPDMADELLLRLQQRLASRPREEPDPVPSVENPAFSELVQYVRQHFREPLQIRELAPRFHVSVSWCCLLFKRVFGRTFSEFVMELRLEEAARLLRKSGKSLQEIAGETGFHDYYHFIRCFSKRFGLPPSRFRKGQMP